MKICVLPLCIFITLSSKGQAFNFLDSNFFNQAKPVLFYTMSSWCSENIADFNLIKDTMIRYRKKYELVMLLDTVENREYQYEFNEILNKINPDKIVIMNFYFPKRLKVLSENRTYTNYFNNFFTTKFYRLGPSSMFYIKNYNVQFVSLTNRKEELSTFFLKWLKEFRQTCFEVCEI